MSIITRKKLAVGAAVAVVAIGGGTAYAYWSTSGSGTGSASTSAGAANLAISQTSTISNLAPGGAAQTITGSVKNNAANSAYVTKVTASIASVTPAGSGSCDASDYTLSSPDMSVGQDLAPGASATFTGATLAFNNKATNQDGCKGATVNLAYAAS
ncbi:MAG: hypothetical protein JO144_15100 [Actinobacteria bacterium]|nr:hypothetical protein [Actinomycetota bacterium]